MKALSFLTVNGKYLGWMMSKEPKIKVTNATMEILHIAGHCEFCGLNTDWPNRFCGWCIENGFNKEMKDV